MIIGIKHQLLRAGISEDDIPYDWLRTITAATCKWFVTTEDGVKQFSRLFCFNLEPSDSAKEYTLVDNLNRTTSTLKNNQVAFFSGALVNGYPVPIADPERKGDIPVFELEISDSAKDQCEDCGIVTHCLKVILDPFTDRQLSLCNYCVTYHEHPKVKDQGGADICRECTEIKCKNHPGRADRYLFV